MMHRFSRLELLVGVGGLRALQATKVAVFGIGGVGSFAAEALARSGIGHLCLIDNDVVTLTNSNRQLIALTDTIGLPKVQVMADRVQQINPNCQVEPIEAFLDESNSQDLLTHDLDYVVDAIDTVQSKFVLIEHCRALNIPFICSMGTGSKFDPTLLQIADISKTSVDPLARTMRKGLRKRGIHKGVKVVFSTEAPPPPLVTKQTQMIGQARERTPVIGTTAFVPAVAGMLLASAVVRDLLNINY